MVGHVVHGDLEGVLVAEDDVGHRVADQDQVDPGGVGDPGSGGVVGGDHHQGCVSVTSFGGADRGHGDRRRAGLGHVFLQVVPSSARRLPAA